MRGYVFISLFAVLVALMFLHWIFYDLLIRIESKKFPLDWNNDGNPIGMFYTPQGSSILAGSLSRQRLMFKWIFQKPNWIKRDEKAENIYKYFRLTGAMYILLFVVFIGSFIAIFLMQS